MNIETHTAPDAIWIHVGGEVDLSNHEQLKTALSRVELNGADVVRIGLADLTFCDVHAFRDLLTFAMEVRQSGHDVAVHRANRMVRRMTQIFGAEQELTFE